MSPPTPVRADRRRRGHARCAAPARRAAAAAAAPPAGYRCGPPQAAVATPTEILTFIERHELHGLGIGYVDVQLLAATQLTPGTGLWTNDKRLAAAAARLGLGLVVDPSAPGDEP